VSAVHPSSLPVTRITPGTRAVTFSIGEIWQARELLYFLVLRDIKVRYKQTVLGLAWAILQPFLTMVVFTIFFGRLAKIPSDGVPYPLFSLAAVVPWSYFATAAASGSNSLVGNQHLLSKVYFPRMLVPLTAVLTPAVDMAVSFVMLVVLIAWYRHPLTSAVAMLPIYVLLGVLSAFAVTLWTSALSVRYRDARYVLPFVIQIWLFVTPVAYPASMVPLRWRALYALNPMATVVEGFRSSLLGTAGPGAMTAIAILVVAAALATGTAYFRSVEGSIVDLA
jgi:lipopolysaccharide transport system permease protein